MLKSLSRLNYGLILPPVMIFTLGFITLLSSSRDKAVSQVIYFLIGLVLYLIFSTIDLRIYRYFQKPIYLGTLLSLIGLFVYGITTLGSTRWLSLGIFTVQPSEVAKISMILFISSYITSVPGFAKSLKSTVKLSVLVTLVIVSVFIQPDLGSSIILFLLFIFMLFMAGIPRVYYLVGIVAVGILSAPIWNLLRDYQKIRILVFLNPQLDVLGHGYNVTQSMISIGAGGLTGRGFGQGSQTHMNFLPVHWTDFIFASFSEEWGFVGIIILSILYLALFYSLLREIYETTDPYSMLIVSGIFVVFFSQYAINIGMNLGILPVTGITLPLMSHGGTSLVMSMAMLGMVQSNYLSRKENK